MWYVLYFLPFEMHILKYRVYHPPSLKSSSSYNGHCPGIFILVHEIIVRWIMKDQGSASVKKISSNFVRSRSTFDNLCFLLLPILPTYCPQCLNSLWRYRSCWGAHYQSSDQRLRLPAPLPPALPIEPIWHAYDNFQSPLYTHRMSSCPIGCW